MTHTISRGKGSRTARTAVAIGAVTLGLAALSACEKPTPRATVTAGANTVSSEAACYEGGKSISQAKVLSCTKQKGGPAVTVGEGDMLRLGVEPGIAESGWVLFLNGQPAMTEPIEKTYRSFPGDAFFSQQSATGGSSKAKSVQLSIVEYDGSKYRGVWNFQLKSD